MYGEASEYAVRTTPSGAYGDVETAAIISRLLLDAHHSLLRDRDTAFRYIQRAYALMRPPIDGDVLEAEAESFYLKGVANQDGGLAAWQIKRVEQYVLERSDMPIKLKELAEVARLSPGYFSRVFKQSFGVSPHDFVIRVRLARAKERMTTTNDSLSEISYACGFADQAHFSRTFRAREGMTPGKWRWHNAHE